MRAAGVVAVILCWGASVCAAQSVADAARQEQQKKAAAAPAKRHVITDDDIASGAAAKSAPDKDPKSAEPSTAASGENGKPSAAEVTAQVKKQKQRVADAEASLKEVEQLAEKWKTSDCSRVIYTESQKNLCADVAKIPEQLKRAQDRVAREKSALETMQESARKAGYHSNVYDPD